MDKHLSIGGKVFENTKNGWMQSIETVIMF